MRNLKRALSLTLASVMLLGMMVLGTSAASYPDVTDEHNVEAIGVLQAVGVMTGSNNGNFNPDSKISRIEMAIVMANLLDLDVDYFQGQNTFSDVPDWASGYVNACAAHGIVTGVGGGRFGTGNVTATQAALMMLKALGYFQYNSDFGDNWARATALKASQIRLFEGINAQDNTQLNRNQVAQLALNALKADMVDAEDNTLHITTGEDAGNLNISGGSVKYTVRATDAAFANAIDDSATGIGGTGNDGRSGNIIQLGEQLYNGDLKLTKNERDDLGRPSNTWTYKNDKIGTYPNKSELIATFNTKASKGDIYSLLSSTVRSALEAADPASGAPRKASLTVTVDGYANAAVGGFPTGRVTTPSDWYIRNSSKEIYTPVADSTRRGTVTEVYLDSDNNVDIAIYNTYVYQATNDYNSSRDEVVMAAVGDTKIALKPGELTLKGEDYAIQDVKADDYLLVTATTDNGTQYSVNSVEVARKVEGTVEGYTENDSVTIDGTKYNYSATTLKSGSGVRTTQYTVGQPAIVVLDKFDNIIAVDEAVASSNFVFIKRFGSTTNFNSDAAADAYFTDGTKATITVDQVEGVKSASTISGYNTVNRWYTYSVNSNGSYVLYAPPTRYGANAAAATKTATATGNSTNPRTQLITNGKVDFMPGALANDKTILVMIDTDGAVMTYTGTANIPDVTPDNTVVLNAYYLVDSDGYTDYVFTDLENKGVSVVDGGNDDSLLYVTRYDGRQLAANATTYFTYKTADIDAQAEVVTKFDKQELGTGAVFALYYKPRVNSDDEISSLTPVPDTGKYFNKNITSGQVAYDNGSLTITGGGASYIVNNSSKIVLVARDSLLKTDPAANNEITVVTPATLESYLRSRSFNGNIAGIKVSSSSNVIDTMYVTVTSVGDFRNVTVAPASLSVAHDGTGTISVTLPTGMTAAVASTVPGTATVSPSSITTTGSAQTVTVTPVANGTTNVTVTVSYTDAATSTTYTHVYTIPVTVSGFVAKTAAQAKTAVDAITTAQKKLAGDVSDATKAAAAAKAVVEGLAGYGITVAEKSPGSYSGATDGTYDDHSGTDGSYTVTYTLSDGTNTVDSASIAFVVPAAAYDNTTDVQTVATAVTAAKATTTTIDKTSATSATDVAEADMIAAAKAAIKAKIGADATNHLDATVVKKTGTSYTEPQFSGGSGTTDGSIQVTVTITLGETTAEEVFHLTFTVDVTP